MTQQSRLYGQTISQLAGQKPFQSASLSRCVFLRVFFNCQNWPDLPSANQMRHFEEMAPKFC